MTTTPVTSAAATVLAAAREHRRQANAAEAAVLADTLAWIELHITDDPADAAVWGDSPVHLGGQGCPWVREFTLTELSAALGMSVASGRRLVSDVLELAFRLPRLWAKVKTGTTPAWRARAVADRTQHLTPEAASFVDAQVAEFVNKMSKAAVDKLVDEAVARFMPDLARQQREQAADQRHLTIDHSQVSFDGTSRIEGELDLADAIDLDTAIGHIADELKDLGNTLPLNSRRALAAGELARRQFAFDYDWDPKTPQTITPATVQDQPKPTPAPAPAPAPATDTSAGTGSGTTAGSGSDTGSGTGTGPGSGSGSARKPRREVILYAHLSTDATTTLTSTGSTDPSCTIDGNATVRIEGHGAGHPGHLITLDTLRDWLTIDGHTKITICPVLDLNARLVSAGRFATDLQREQLHLRDQTCAAPHCTRPARHLDADHIDPWVDPDETGSDADTGGRDKSSPPGRDDPELQTTSDNLGSLCRHHHRAKTLAGWSYQQLFPGVFFWESPHGLRFLTYQGQTIDLN